MAIGNYIASTKENPFTGTTTAQTTVGIYPTIQVANVVEAEDTGVSQVRRLEVHVTPLSGSATPTVGLLHTSRRLFSVDGGAPVVELKDGLVGQEVQIVANGPREFVHGPSLRLAGGINFVMEDGDSLSLTLFAEGVWTEVARSDG